MDGAVRAVGEDDTLAQAVEGRYPLTLVLDQASIHKNVDAIGVSRPRLTGHQGHPAHASERRQAHEPTGQRTVHDWKEIRRERCPVTRSTIQQVMADAWNKLPARLFHSHYKKCGLVRGQDPYFDCPDLAGHEHVS